MNFAKWAGFELLAPEDGSILQISCNREQENIIRFKLLEVLEFTSERLKFIDENKQSF